MSGKSMEKGASKSKKEKGLMRKLLCLGVGVLLGMSTMVGAQEMARVGCDAADPANNCPGADCVCSDDILEIVFDGADGTNSVLEYAEFVEGMEIDVWQVGDIVTDSVQGWSLGVTHAGDDLDLVEVTYAGGPAESAIRGGISILDLEDIQTCEGGALECKNVTVPASGYIQAVIMHFKKEVFVDPGMRHPFTTAKYALKRDVGAGGTLIQVTKSIGKAGSPPADVNLTIGGQSKTPATWIDGWVKGVGGVATETVCDDGVDDDADGATDCDDSDCAADAACDLPATETSCDNAVDDDGDGSTDCDDSDCADDVACDTGGTCESWALYFGSTATTDAVAVGAETSYAVSMRNATDSLGFQLGIGLATAGGTTTHTFSATLGRENALIDLIISDLDGNGQAPATPNSATSDESTISNIERGAAIAAFSDADFFAWDGDPEVGGPGATAVHVADLNPPANQAGNVIPATADGAPCSLNEVLVVTLGGDVGQPFSRGDADGDGKLNVLDAVLIIQFAANNLPLRVDCMKAYDADDDGLVDVMDAVPVLMYTFQRGADLASPFRVCGQDGSSDALGCTDSNCQ